MVNIMLAGASLLFTGLVIGYWLARHVERLHAREVWRAKDGVMPYVVASDSGADGPKPGDVEESK